MAVRIKDGMIPYTGGDGIEITDNHVINVLLRAANNLIHINENKELYVDLQLPDGIEPTDTFPAGVTVGRILEEDGRDHSGLILNWKTISGDYCRLIYSSDDGDLYYDPGTGEWIKLGNLFGGTAWGDITGTLSQQTDLQNALDEKVNIGDNLILDGTVVSIKEASDSGGTVVGSGKRVDIDPAGKVTAYKATVSGYDESELGAGELTLTHNTALGGNQTATINNEKISADNGQMTKDYAFFGNDRIATLSDLSGIIPPPVDVNVKYFYLSGTTGQSNLDTAQDAYDYVQAGGISIIGLNGVTYVYESNSGNVMSFASTVDKTKGSSSTNLSKKRLQLTVSSGDVTTITENTVSLFNGVELGESYNMPYTPTNPGDPATKDYADNCANTKTFYLASDQDTTTAGEILAYYNAGHNPVVSYNNEIYVLSDILNGFLNFASAKPITLDSTGKTLVGYKKIAIRQTANGVTISIRNQYIDSYISSNATYSTVSYMPTNPGNPANKKYVDYKVEGAISSGPTAPSNPTVGQIWYDTVNNVLKIWNGSSWVIIDIASVSDAAYSSAWNNDTTHAPSKNAVYDIIQSISGQGHSFGSFVNLCKASGTSHSVQLNKYYLPSGGGTIINVGTASYTMQGSGWLTGQYQSANDCKVTLEVNGVKILEEDNSSGNIIHRYITSPITFSAGDVVSVTCTQGSSTGGQIIVDIVDYY